MVANIKAFILKSHNDAIFSSTQPAKSIGYPSKSVASKEETEHVDGVVDAPGTGGGVGEEDLSQALPHTRL